MTYIHAKYIGLQESCIPGIPAFALWTLCEDVPNHPKGSTLSIQTLEGEGYVPVEVDEEEPC